MRVSRCAADLSLAAAAFFWGATFVIVKEAVARVDVFFFLSQRFLLAAILLVFICILLRRPISVRDLRYGAVMGLFLFGCFAFQTSALLYTTATNTAFITGLYVVLTPLGESVLFGKKNSPLTALGAGLALVGLYLLCSGGISWSFNKGDMLALVCAAAATLHIIFTGRYAPRGDIYWMTAVQITVIGLMSLAVATLQGTDVFVYRGDIRSALIVCVLFATVIAFLVQTSMQRFTGAAQTALILCLEPVFAAIYAYFAIGETLGWAGLAGAALILAGMIASELPGLREAPGCRGRN